MCLVGTKEPYHNVERPTKNLTQSLERDKLLKIPVINSHHVYSKLNIGDNSLIINNAISLPNITNGIAVKLN